MKARTIILSLVSLSFLLIIFWCIWKISMDIQSINQTTDLIERGILYSLWLYSYGWMLILGILISFIGLTIFVKWSFSSLRSDRHDYHDTKQYLFTLKEMNLNNANEILEKCMQSDHDKSDCTRGIKDVFNQDI